MGSIVGVFAGFIESFDLDIKNISREQLPILDALTELEKF